MHLALANFMRADLHCLRTEMAEYSVLGTWFMDAWWRESEVGFAFVYCRHD